MNILITGGSGFVGGYVYRYFQQQNYSVLNYDISGNKGDPNFIKGSILDYENLKNIIFENDISIIFHFAGFSNINKVKSSPRDCIDLNILGTTNRTHESSSPTTTRVIHNTSTLG